MWVLGKESKNSIGANVGEQRENAIADRLRKTDNFGRFFSGSSWASWGWGSHEVRV